MAGRRSSFGTSTTTVSEAINDSAYDNVKIVADNINDVNTVSAALDAGKFDIVSNNIADVVAVANNIADVVTTAGIEVEIQSVAADKVTLDSIFADKITLDSIFADKATLDSLFVDKTVLDSLYADKAALDRVYSSIENIDIVIPHVDNIDTVADNVSSVSAVGSDIANVNSVAATVVPNIVEILQADDNAIIATTKAGEALASASNASSSESNALASENKAEKWAEEDEDVEVETGKYSAKHWSEKSKDWVVGSTIDDTTPRVDKSYSGSKVETELLERDGRLDTAETKLATIEEGATADQTKADIDALGIDAVTVNGKTVETSVPVGAAFTDTLYDDTAIQAEVDLNTAKRSYPVADENKLASIEDNATADQTAGEIESLYEGIADTNKYTDAEKTKLANVEIAQATYTNKTLDDYTNKIKANAVHMRVKNQSGVVMLKGTVVSYFGYSDTEDAVKVVKANNATGVAIGILAEELAIDAFGRAIANGIVDGLDTSAYTNGTILYTDTLGGLTDVEPTTGFAQPIAYVLKSNATIGVLQVLAAYPKQDASDVRVTPVGELTSSTVQGGLEELQSDVDTLNSGLAEVAETVDNVYLDRADKYLAAQVVANMVYTDGKLTKVRYVADTDTDYEVLSYNTQGKLINVAHYVDTVLEGNTALSYTSDKLSSAIYTGV